MSALQFHRAGIVYGSGPTRTIALAPTDLTVDSGETVAVVGRSGAGKTSLAELALGLRTPSYGHITVDGEVWSAPGRKPPRHNRGRVQGVPQDAQVTLPPRWSVGTTLQNTARRLSRDSTGDGTVDGAADSAIDNAIDSAIERALAVAQCDPDLLTRRPHQLSGGQAQRIAIARALVARPSVIVADEPTSALDDETAGRVVDTLFGLARSSGVAIVVVTHDQSIADRCGRILRVRDGCVEDVAR